MRILIFEPDMTGHHAPYLRHLILALDQLGQTAIVATSRGATRTEQFKIHLANVADRATFDEFADPVPKASLPRARSWFAEIRRAVQRHNPEHIWVPYADILTEWLAARALAKQSRPWPADVESEGLYFRGRFAYPAERWQKQLTRILGAKLLPHMQWTLLHFLDPIPWEVARRKHPELVNRFQLMPDPVERVTQCEPAAARAALGIPVGGRILGCIGLVNSGKQIAPFVAAFREARQQESDRLLMAGPTSKEVCGILARDFHDLLQAGQIIHIDRQQSVDEVMLAVMASDLVCVPTPYRMGSSSFVIRAAAARRPVLADQFGWTGWVVPEFALGWSADMRNLEGMKAGLRSALDGLAGWQPSAAAERFVRFHAADNFKAHWTARLRERLGLPQDEHYYAWESVIAE